MSSVTEREVCSIPMSSLCLGTGTSARSRSGSRRTLRDFRRLAGRNQRRNPDGRPRPGRHGLNTLSPRLTSIPESGVTISFFREAPDSCSGDGGGREDAERVEVAGPEGAEGSASPMGFLCPRGAPCCPAAPGVGSRNPGTKKGTALADRSLCFGGLPKEKLVRNQFPEEVTVSAGSAAASAVGVWSTHSRNAIGAESLGRWPSLMIRV